MDASALSREGDGPADIGPPASGPMLTAEPPRVMVCVGPGEDCRAALDFAVVQARTRECGIHLVTALRPDWTGITRGVDLHVGTTRQHATASLIGCEQHVRALSEGSVCVSAEIVHGSVAPTLVEETGHASLVVVQHHRMNRERRLPSLSVTNGLAARARAAVVAVPDVWRESEEHPDVIVVGVQDSISSREVVKAAFEEAQRVGAEVHLVQAWFFSVAFDALGMASEVARLQNRAVEEEITRAFAAVAGEFPDVVCRVVAAHGQAPDALVAKSEHARLLVVGRHDPVLPLGSRLGPVTRRVLNNASCPVLVIDPRP